MNLLHCEGFSYSFDPTACSKCEGACCRGKHGFIWVNAEEIERIAKYLQMSMVDFIGQFLYRVDNRLSICERFNEGHHECVFFNSRDMKCAIYDVRPAQCRAFPFWSYFIDRENELQNDCPGVMLAG